jgi:hypothetical protein
MQLQFWRRIEEQRYTLVGSKSWTTTDEGYQWIQLSAADQYTVLAGDVIGFWADGKQPVVFTMDSGDVVWATHGTDGIVRDLDLSTQLGGWERSYAIRAMVLFECTTLEYWGWTVSPTLDRFAVCDGAACQGGWCEGCTPMAEGSYLGLWGDSESASISYPLPSGYSTARVIVGVHYDTFVRNCLGVVRVGGADVDVGEWSEMLEITFSYEPGDILELGENSQCKLMVHSLDVMGGCAPCGPGLFDHDRHPFSPCIACTAGRFSSGGTDECTQCPAGGYTPPGSAVCGNCTDSVADYDSDPATPCGICGSKPVVRYDSETGLLQPTAQCGSGVAPALEDVSRNCGMNDPSYLWQV